MPNSKSLTEALVHSQLPSEFDRVSAAPFKINWITFFDILQLRLGAGSMFSSCLFLCPSLHVPNVYGMTVVNCYCTQVQNGLIRLCNQKIKVVNRDQTNYVFRHL